MSQSTQAAAVKQEAAAARNGKPRAPRHRPGRARRAALRVQAEAGKTNGASTAAPAVDDRVAVCTSCKKTCKLTFFGPPIASGFDSECRRCKMFNKVLVSCNMTREDFERMLAAQHNQCKICSVTFSEKVALHVDIWHVDNQPVVRGIICKPCNRGIEEKSLSDLVAAALHVCAGYGKSANAALQHLRDARDSTILLEELQKSTNGAPTGK